MKINMNWFFDFLKEKGLIGFSIKLADKELADKIKKNNNIDRSFYGELGVPEDKSIIRMKTIKWEDVSHQISNIRISDSGEMWGDIVVLNTPNGKLLKDIIQSGKSIVSVIRAFMNVNDNNIINLITWDIELKKKG